MWPVKSLFDFARVPDVPPKGGARVARFVFNREALLLVMKELRHIYRPHRALAPGAPAADRTDPTAAPVRRFQTFEPRSWVSGGRGSACNLRTLGIEKVRGQQRLMRIILVVFRSKCL